MGLFDLFTDKKKRDRLFFRGCSSKTSKESTTFFDSEPRRNQPIEAWGPGSPHLCAGYSLGEWVSSRAYVGRTH